MESSEIYRVRFCRGSRTLNATLQLSGVDVGADAFKREAAEALVSLGVTVTLRRLRDTEREAHFCVEELWTSGRSLVDAVVGELRESFEGGLD